VNLVIAPGLLDRVIEHATAHYPHEACGLLVGRGRADRFIPMTNALASSTEYEMDPAQLIATLRELRGSGEELIAIYHSHPRGPAKPSKKDIERAYYPDAVHLIISLADPERPQAAAFRIIDGEALEIEVHAIV
jgi:[CysO sulfur-carrier protein]-S-L-cysteine hydrolase